MWRRLFSTSRKPRWLARSLYGRAGTWQSKFTIETKRDCETFWKDKVNDFSNPKGDKSYVLAMFPYPSGNLHLGHIRVYTIGDVLSRYLGLQGKNVIYPIGWDSFGLPAENAAIERGEDPRAWTKHNILSMKKQLKDFNFGFTWDREISTCDPSYYKWTQYLFVKLFEKGLLYRKEAVVNWDPVDDTTIADEQVDAEGRSWRSGALVEKKLLNQWYIKTTEYTEKLFTGLDHLEGWGDISAKQKGWIGDINEGVVFEFALKSSTSLESIKVWTDRPELLAGAAFIVLTKNHLLSHTLKTGKAEAVNPLTGKSLPIFVDEDVFTIPKSTQAFLGIPCDSEAEGDFAKQRNIEFVSVLDGNAVVNSGQFDGPREKAREEILKYARTEGFGGFKSSKVLRDWLISRQRYWGTPIPIIHCETCGPVAVPEKDLPVELPVIATGLRLSEAEEWLRTVCPKCASPARRESDTMDTFVDSSWYYLRYLDPRNKNSLADQSKLEKMMPVDVYIGGEEHAVMHLYYARFMAYFMHKELGLGNEEFVEPFKKMIVQGMVLNETFSVTATGKFLPKSEVDLSDPKRPTELATGEPVSVKWDKMSKSKHNGIVPQDLTAKYGIDSTRLFILAGYGPTAPYKWPSPMFDGILGWQLKLWMTVDNFRESRKICAEKLNEKQEKDIRHARNDYIHLVNNWMERSQQYHMVLRKMQNFTKVLRSGIQGPNSHLGPEYERGLGDLLITLYPFCPHFASELWEAFVDQTRYGWYPHKVVSRQNWPVLDEDFDLSLIVRMAGEAILTESVPQDTFRDLTGEQAAEMVRDKLPEPLRESKPKLHKIPLYVAYLNYPFVKGIVSMREKRKQEKKTAAQ